MFKADILRRSQTDTRVNSSRKIIQKVVRHQWFDGDEHKIAPVESTTYETKGSLYTQRINIIK